VVSALLSTLSAFQWPAYTPATTLLIPKQHLGRASGMVQMEQGIVQLLAPVLGGLLLEIIQLQGVVLLDMATCLFALVTLLSVHFPRASATPVGEPDKDLAATRDRLRLDLSYFPTWATRAADVLRRQQLPFGYCRSIVRAASVIVRFT
jgi:MFS family permease